MQEIIEPKKLYPFQDQAVTNIFNQLIELPELPNVIKQLYCWSNQLILLPDLPNKIKYISGSIIYFDGNTLDSFF